MILAAEKDPLMSPDEMRRLWSVYGAMHKQYLQAFRRQKADDERLLNLELQSAKNRGELKRFWTMLKQRRGYFESKSTPVAVVDESGELQSGKQAADVWSRLYSKIGNERDEADEKIQQSSPFDSNFRANVEKKLRDLMRTLPANPELDLPISYAEIEHALTLMKTYAAAGPDQLPNSLLRLMRGHDSKMALVVVFNRIWRSKKWPDVWREGDILPLFKGGTGAERTNVNDYRPITLTDSISKLFELVLLQRLTKWCESRCLLVEEQGGFRRGRGTLDQIFTLHEIVASRRERRKLTFMAFLDCRRAYDRVWRDGLLLKLIEAGITGTMFEMLRSMLQMNRRRVVLQGECSDQFETTVGLPQGAVLSPLLYALFINGLAEELKSRGLGVDFFGRRVGILLYADDIVLVAESPEQLQLMLDCASDYAANWQFRFNTKPGKSDVVVAPHKTPVDRPFLLSGMPLHVSEEYKYLGVEMGKTGKGCWNAYIHRARRNALSAMQQLLYSVSGRVPLQLATSVHLFKTLVRPVVEYASAIWGVMCSDTALQMLEQVQERFGRRVLRLPSNTAGEFVRRELRLESVRQRTSMAGFRFFGHLAAMPGNRLAAFVFRQRCDQVDDGEATNSWCKVIKEKLTTEGWASIWTDRTVPDDWRKLVDKKLELKFDADSSLKMQAMSTLTVYRRMGRARDVKWLDRVFSHPGAAIRLKLRCGALPLMMRVGAEMDIPRESRICLMCDEKQVEDACHFVSACPHFADMRRQCLERVETKLGAVPAPQLRNAIESSDPELFLGDRLLAGLPQDVEQAVDTVICDFLKVAWRRRQQLWKEACLDGNEWRLRPERVPAAR